MFYYKKFFMDDWCYYASEQKPKKLNGLVEITKEEYEKAIAELESIEE